MARVASYPGIAEAKARSLDLLAGRSPVLDIGCGTGEEVRQLDGVGIDSSAVMLSTAAHAGGRFVRGDAHWLPVRRGAFAGARADRVLQHVADPAAVVAELVRCLAPGAVVVVIDPDQSTLAIDGPNPELAARVVDWRANECIRHGDIAGHTAAMLQTHAVDHVAVERYPVVLREPAEAFGLPTWSGLLTDRGWFTPSEAKRFDESLRTSAGDGVFRYRLDIVVTSARVATTGS